MINEKKKQTIKTFVFFSVILMAVLVIFRISFFGKQEEMNTKKKSISCMQRKKIVTTVQVKKGSTLWDIATEYCTEEYQNVNELVEEIKVSNGMQQNTIHEDAYLIVPYYVSSK